MRLYRPVGQAEYDLIAESGFTAYAVGGCVRDGVRRIRLPRGVKSLKCLTGQHVRYPDEGFAEVDIDCGKAAIFSVSH